MRFCNNCGKQVKDRGAFCSHCGKAIEQAESNILDVSKASHQKADKMDGPGTMNRSGSGGGVKNKKFFFFLIPVFLLIVALITVVSVFSKSDWKQSYIKYLKKCGIENEDSFLSNTSFTIADVNEDGIPEIFSYDAKAISLNTNVNVYMIDKEGQVIKSSLGRYGSYCRDVIRGEFDEEFYFLKELYPRDEDFEDIDRPILIEAYYAIDSDSGKLILEHEAKKSEVSNASFIDGIKISSTLDPDFKDYDSIKNGFYDQDFKSIAYSIGSEDIIKEIKKYKVEKKNNLPQREDGTTPPNIQTTEAATTVAAVDESVLQVGSEMTLTEEQKSGISELIKTLAWVNYGEDTAKLTKDGDFIAAFMLYSADKHDSIINKYDGANKGFEYGVNNYQLSITEKSLQRYLKDSIGVDDITVLKDWVIQNEVDSSRTHLLNYKDGTFLFTSPDSGEIYISEPIITKITAISKDEILIEGSIEESSMNAAIGKEFKLTMTVNADSIWGGYRLEEIKEWKSEPAAAVTSEWKQAYEDAYIRELQETSSSTRATLIYLDNDDIPECILWLTPYDAANDSYRTVRVLSYKDGAIVKFTSEEAGYNATFSYTERSGKFEVEEVLGLRSATWWEIVELNGGFKKIGSAWTDNDWDQYYFQINDKEVENQEMFDYLNSYGFKTVLTNSDLYSSITEAYHALIAGTVGADNTAAVLPDSTDYILPDSNSRYLSAQDLSGLSKEQLRMARNEIYARHGFRFTKEDTKQYFESKSWYSGAVAEVTDNMLNKYEIANRELIISIEGSGTH